MSQLRADLWCSAFVRRHNDFGHVCVVSRKGDPVAGQIWIEVDHLNGTVSLYAPAPALLHPADDVGRVFQCKIDHGTPADIRARLEREADFDPDFWLITLEMRSGDPGFAVV